VVLALLLVGAFVIWQGKSDDGGTTTADPTSAPAPTSAAGTPTTASTAPSTTESAPSTPPETTTETPSPTPSATSSAPSTTPPSSAGAAQGSAAEVEQAITSYYSLLPGNPQAAYDRTGPTLQAAESRSNYVAFWNRFSSVTLGPVSVSEGSLTATAPVTFVEDGTSLPEQHTFTLVRGADGQLLIDSDRAQ
jgi:eukaryotic-like serine/threonine-protein kinase